MSNVDKLTDEEIELVLEEKRRREELRRIADLEGYTRRPKVFAVCSNKECKFPYTEDEVEKFKVCPVCGEELAEVI